MSSHISETKAQELLRKILETLKKINKK